MDSGFLEALEVKRTTPRRPDSDARVIGGPGQRRLEGR